ncbi:MAG: ABC transporter permease [Anaerolineales bacterium]
MNLRQIRRQWAFYLKHSLRDLARNGGRTFFALFCIATGVAAVVALRSLALMIGDELTLNLAELNRGDIQIVASNDIDTAYWTLSQQNDPVFSDAGLTELRAWAESENADIQFGSSENLLQVQPLGPDDEPGQPFPVVPVLVNPETWPFYGEARLAEPAGLTLQEVFADDGLNLVVSRRIALENNISLGDRIRVPGAETPLTVAGIAADESEGSLALRNGPAGFVGFVYYPLERAPEIGLDPLPTTAYIRLPLGRDVTRAADRLEARFGENIAYVTTAELEEENQEAADLINDLVLVMGLSAILIGGIGIVNTMNVIVARRTLEIAVLKTMGLKAWRVTALFLVEAALMGIIGSVIGILAGIGLSYSVRNVGETVLNAELAWRAYPEAWFSGATLGVIITICFGFLPTLNAGQVRPAGVLRPNEITLPNAGLTRTLGTIFLVMILFGLTLNIIIRGQLELPIALMLALGGFILGGFAGIMLHNEGIMKRIPADAGAEVARRGVWVFAGAVGALSLIGLGGAEIAFGFGIPALAIYGLPAALFISLLLGLSALTRTQPEFAVSVARGARQTLLLGGAIVLGALIGGGVYFVTIAVLAVLYPAESPPPGTTPARVVAVVLFLASALIFRTRARGAAGLVGLGVIGATFSAVVGFGLGDALEALFGGFGFWSDLERASTGIVVVQILVLAMALVFAAMLGVVWILSKTPTFKNVDAKLALRNMNARRPRTAATMMGLTAGIAALSLITLTTSGVTTLLEGQLQAEAGGNVLVLSRNPEAADAVSKRLEEQLPGVRSYAEFTLYTGRLIAVDGEEPDVEGFETGDAADGNRFEVGQQENEPGIGFGFTTIDPRQNADLEYEMTNGRFLRPEDIGQPVMVIREPPAGSPLDLLGIEVGTEITWLLRPPPGSEEEPIERTFTIIGLIDENSQQTGVAIGFQAPIESVPEFIRPNSYVTVADIEDDFVDEAIFEFAGITNAFAIEISYLVQVIENLIAQLIAIPALVAFLALVAGIAIIANTVALDTQERRQQIGVMKAVGLKGWRVLAQLVFEYALIGLVAGLIGAAIGLIATLWVGVLGNAQQLEDTLQLWPAARLVGLGIFVAVLATLASAWTAARESPMDVLRYE